MTALEYLLFPGFIFIVTASFLVSWIDMKITAFLEDRNSRSLLQHLFDVIKLTRKEIVVPRDASIVLFLISPVLSFCTLIAVCMILVRAVMFGEGFLGDIFVVFYLMLLPSIAVVLGGVSSFNPLSYVGAVKNMNRIIFYELPLVMAINIVIIKTGGMIGVQHIIKWQLENKVVMGSVSGIIAFFIFVICMQAKMAQIPFNIFEKEFDIAKGANMEYSGGLLCLFMMSRWVLLLITPLFASIMFLGGINSITGITKYFIVFIIMGIVKKTYFMGENNVKTASLRNPLLVISLIGVLLAIIGL